MGPPMRIGDWETSPSFWLGDGATLCRTPVSPQSWPGGRTDFSSGHWPASGVDRHNCGCRVDGPLNFPHDLLWVIPCQGMPQIAGSRAVRVLFQALGWLVLNPS
jgi:hypothetical protein